jgi:hypothetical protein
MQANGKDEPIGEPNGLTYHVDVTVGNRIE